VHIQYTDHDRWIGISFESENDAMLFKLTWM
jgi:hypothetical protein